MKDAIQEFIARTEKFKLFDKVKLLSWFRHFYVIVVFKALLIVYFYSKLFKRWAVPPVF